MLFLNTFYRTAKYVHTIRTFIASVALRRYCERRPQDEQAYDICDHCVERTNPLSLWYR